MPIKLGVVMDAIGTIKAKKDTTLAMLLEAQKRGWCIEYMEQKDIFLADTRPQAYLTKLTVKDDIHDWYHFGERHVADLASLDVILMRKDPPFDMEYVYTTYLLELAEQAGTLVINKPQSLRDANEKLYTSWFPSCCPETLVTRDAKLLRAFITQHKKVVFKPLDSMGGRSIFLLEEGDPNINVVIETLTNWGEQFMMAQRFIPEIMQGDKRILLINGEPIDYALARIPARGEIRGNLAAGGTGVVVPLSAHDRLICQQVGPVLRAKGLVFVGIDVIGDYLTEINVTSPTCLREIEAGAKIAVAERLFDCIAQYASK